MPTVSICIPAYKPDFFETALRSALGQSYTDVEIIVSDDCPTDAIAAICSKFPGHVQYSRNPRPGLELNVRRLFELASGTYIKFLFDDDVLHPFCIQYLLQLLEETRDRGTTLALSPRYIIDERNYATQLVDHFKAREGVKLVTGREFIRVTAINHVNLVGEFTTVLFRKADAYDADGAFRLFRMEGDTFEGLTDLSAWVTLADAGNLVVHPEPLSYFRHHSNATSNPAINPRFIVAVTYYEDVLNYAIARGHLRDDEIIMARQNLIRHYRHWLPSYPILQDRIALLERA